MSSGQLVSPFFCVSGPGFYRMFIVFLLFVRGIFINFSQASSEGHGTTEDIKEKSTKIQNVIWDLILPW